MVPMSQQHAEGRPRPLISLIIPVYNVADYLTECLDSITRQEFENVEIIAVDGASTDVSRKILDKRRLTEPRLTVVHADKIGPGLARNEGARQAEGEYIWFIDGDDVIPDGSLAAIAHRIDAVRPDVLFIDHEDVDPNGKLEPGIGHDLLGRETAECFTLDERPWVLELSMASWKKIIRREFFRSAHVTFPAEYPHEDIPVSCLLLTEARKLSILNQVCYRYRKNRAGSAQDVGPADRHFNIFRSYGSVLDQIGKRIGDSDLTEDIQRALFNRAIWHYTNIFDTAGWITPEDRRKFFEQMSWHFVHYLPADYQYVPGLRGVKYRLIAANAYRTYTIMGRLNGLRVKAEHGSRIVRRARHSEL